jgi:hypothetical protein
MATSTHAPLQWGRIFLTAVLASVFVLLVLLISIQLFPAWWLAFCPVPSCSDLGCIIGWALGCLAVLTIVFLVLDFIGVMIAAVLLIWPRVSDRRWTHVILTVILSTIINVAVIYIIDAIT